MKKMSAFMLVILGSMPLYAAPVSKEEMVRQVSVQGRGKIKAVPDLVRLWIEVTEEGPKLEEVSARERSKIDAVLKAVRSQGVADKDIQTQSYQVTPIYSWQDRKQERTGYSAANRVQVTLHDLKKSGSVISAAEDAGANTVNGPVYDFENPQVLERKALELAMDDAKAKAALLAQASGASLGEVLTIQENGTSFPVAPRPYRMMKAMAPGAASEAEPISEGEQTVESTVSVSYALH